LKPTTAQDYIQDVYQNELKSSTSLSSSKSLSATFKVLKSKVNITEKPLMMNKGTEISNEFEKISD